jgi:D-alanyl-D-alanine carboxypeptidase
MVLRLFVNSALHVSKLAAVAAIGLAAISLIATPAEARHWRHFRHYAHRHAVPQYAPGFASMVVDANTGRTLSATNENELRHPASITKVMTLYLLFEQLEKGRLSLDSPLTVSEHAASQAPSKLGIEPGEAISVENAIKAVVTRSANDVAVAIAENIGGDEQHFAEMMTRKAHALGMSRTTYVNASGLPDDNQITTARDLTVLARAIQERFPRYFRYFSTHSFEYAGEVIGNHNHLLGRVDGVDGIKTGYTRASGFNLLTSVHRDGRSLVAVVLGGPTPGWRDRVMEGLIAQHIAQASNGGHSAPMIADNSPSSEPTRVAEAVGRSFAPLPPVAPPAPVRTAMSLASLDLPASGVRSGGARISEGEGDDDGVEPTVVAKPVVADKAAVAKAVSPASRPAVASAPKTIISAPAPKAVVAVAAPVAPAALGWVKGPEGAAPAKSAAQANDKEAVKAAAVAPHPVEETRIAREEAKPATPHNGWVIQVGATDAADKAADLLSRAKERNHAALASARPFTEKFQKGDETLFRARFAELDSNSAENACKSLKRNGFSCFATRD